MNVSTQLLDYNALAICSYNPSNKCVTITCGIQPTGVVTMAMEVLHNRIFLIHTCKPSALRLWAYITGKSLTPMLSLLLVQMVCAKTHCLVLTETEGPYSSLSHHSVCVRVHTHTHKTNI